MISYKKLQLLCIFLGLFTSLASATPKYIMVVDAGSTGSRLHVYKTVIDAKNHVEIQDIFSKKMKPALASFAATPEHASDNLLVALDEASIPLGQQNVDPHQVPIFVLSTAGMRLLGDEQRNNINTAVTDALRAHNYQTVTVKTIPGEHEAIYDWVTVNQLAGHLNNGSLTDGVLDLGGASTEIAFSAPRSRNHVYHFCIHKQCHSVFAVSFLGLGANYAAQHVQNYGDVSQCYPRGYDNSGYNIGVTGDYHAAACQSATDNLVKQQHLQEVIGTVPKNMHFYAVSEYYNVLDFFKEKPKLEDLKAITTGVCQSNDWQKMKTKFKEEPVEKIARHCFDVNLILSLLGNSVGFGFHNHYPRWDAVDRLNGTGVDWTLGAAMYALYGSGLTH